MKIKTAVAVFVFIGIIAYAAFSAQRDFSPAADLPGEALVYAEFTDLPAFLRLWENSELKQKYLDSENFDSLAERRLGLKLASRWQEFNEAVGFTLDLETIGGLAEKRAAIGIYDIGKLELVFVAPISNEIFTATKLFQNIDHFEEKLLDDGTSVFSADVHADRGRQPQKLLIAHLKERFVLATSEKLLLQTIANINGKANKHRLTDEPAFKGLAENSKPNLALVWVNQTALNKDYYFKRYWLMPNTSRLKNIRAGIFAVSMEENKIVERRRFLLEKQANTAKLNAADAQEMISLVPTETAFYRLQTANVGGAVNAIFDCIFDRAAPTAKAEARNNFLNYSFYDFDDSEQEDYEHLNRKFDETIDEVSDDNFNESKVAEDKSYRSNLEKVLQAANPQSVLSLTAPKNLPVPLFAEFRRAAVIKTGSSVNQAQLENAVAQAARSRISISAAQINLAWKSVAENGATWRQLNLPMLGWEICYAQRGENLIVSNNSTLLREILARAENAPVEKVSETPIDNLTVVRLENKSENFDEIFGRLASEDSNDFFLGSVGSLLETVSGVKTIQIETSANAQFRDEKITFNLE